MNIQQLRHHIAQDNTEFALKLFITAWALFIVALALLLHNKWLLAGIILYEVLP